MNVHIKAQDNLLTGLLFIVFLVLKLTHVIDWSWWWVFAPVWGPPAFVVLLLIAAFIFITVARK